MVKKTNQRSGQVDMIGIREGGTGFPTMAQFRQEYNILGKDDTRVVKLGADGKIPAGSLVTDAAASIILSQELIGLTGQTIQASISNYDSYTPYSVVSQNGNVSINGNTVSYTIPLQGQAGFSINGQAFNVESHAVVFEKPVMTSANGLYLDMLRTVFTIGNMVNNQGTSLAKTVLEYCFASDFSSVVTAIDLTEAQLSKYIVDTDKTKIVYFRVKHIDIYGNSSEYSDTIISNPASLGKSIVTPILSGKKFADSRVYTHIFRVSEYVDISGVEWAGTEYLSSASADFSSPIISGVFSGTGGEIFGTVGDYPSFYTKVRHVDANGMKSDWSNTVYLASDSYIVARPNVEKPSILPPSSMVATEYGTYISVSDGGMYITVHNKYGDGFDIYHKENDRFVLYQTIPNSTYSGISGSASRTVVNEDGRVIVATKVYSSGATHKHRIIYYKRTATGFIETSAIDISDLNNSTSNPTEVHCDDVGKLVIIGNPAHSNSKGYVAVYDFNISSAPAPTFTSTGTAEGDKLGACVKVARRAQMVAYSLPSTAVRGAVYWRKYSKVTNTFDVLRGVGDQSSTVLGGFGTSFAIGDDGTDLFIGNPAGNSGSGTIFNIKISEDYTTWSLVSQLSMAYGTTGLQYGAHVSVSRYGGVVAVSGRGTGGVAAPVRIIDAYFGRLSINYELAPMGRVNSTTNAAHLFGDCEGIALTDSLYNSNNGRICIYSV